MQNSNIDDVEVRTCRSPDLRRKIATVVAVAQLSLVRTLLMRKLIHRFQTEVCMSFYQIHTLQTIQKLNEIIGKLHPFCRHRPCGVAILPRGVAIFHAASPSLRGVAIIAASPSLRGVAIVCGVAIARRRCRTCDRCYRYRTEVADAAHYS